MKEMIERVQNLTDEKLISDLKAGPDGFISGVYEIYLEEANKRNIKVEPQEAIIQKESKIRSKLKEIKIPVILKLSIRFSIYLLLSFIVTSLVIAGLNFIYYDQIVYGIIDSLPLYVTILKFFLLFASIIVSFYWTIKKSKHIKIIY